MTNCRKLMGEEFRNREEYWFYSEGDHRGCIYGIDRMHEEYMGGKLSDAECFAVDKHRD